MLVPSLCSWTSGSMSICVNTSPLHALGLFWRQLARTVSNTQWVGEAAEWPSDHDEMPR